MPNQLRSVFGRNFAILGEKRFSRFAVVPYEPKLVFDFPSTYYRTGGVDRASLSDAMTFARAGSATYTDATGTIQTAAANVPRAGHHVWDGSAWVNEGLLLESEARTNLLTQSEDFSSGGWYLVNSSLTTNTSAAPDGATTADRLVEGSTTTDHSVRFNPTIVPSTTYTVSVFVKAGSGAERALRIDFANSTFSNGFRVLFNPTTGLIAASEKYGLGTLLSTSAEFAGNGWYRVSITGTVDATETSGRFIFYMQSNLASFSSNYTGDGSSNLLLWGAQLEAGPTPSSYIPTSGATATRAAETLTIPAANLPWNPLAVSIQMDGRVTFSDTDKFDEAVFYNWQIDGSNRVYSVLRTDSSVNNARVEFWQAAAGVNDASRGNFVYPPGVLVPFNVAARNGSNFVQGSVDGTAAAADTTPVALANLSASNLSLANKYNGTIRTFRMWPNDLGDTGIEEASA